MSVILLINVVVATAAIVFAFTRPELKSGSVMLLVSGILMLMFISAPPLSSITAPAVDKNGDLIIDRHGKPVYSADFVHEYVAVYSESLSLGGSLLLSGLI